MGMDLQTLRFVLASAQSGADFSRVATLGRQHINVDRDTYVQEARRYGFATDDASNDAAFSAYPFCDGLLKQLGSKFPFSVDVADFEEATHIADLNHPVPDAMHGAFSTLIDGGALEHVFDIKQAFENVGAMVAVGGHFVLINVANNFMGHGFYQFSPELCFRVFSEENGFEIEEMVLTETNDDAIWHDIIDPEIAGRRVQLVNNSKTYVMMRARKIAEVPMFQTTPQQSDYQNIAWKIGTEKRSFMAKPWYKRMVEGYMPRPVRSALRRISQGTRDHFSSPDLKARKPFS